MPSLDSSSELVQHFGSEGLRLFGQGSLLGVGLPAAVRNLLQKTEVPRGVGSYFLAAGAEDPVTLGAFAARVSGLQPSAPMGVGFGSVSMVWRICVCIRMVLFRPSCFRKRRRTCSSAPIWLH